MASTKHNFRIKNGLEVGNELIVNGITIVNSEGVLQNPAGYNNSNWDTAFGWGNHASAGYQTTSGSVAQSHYVSGNAFATTGSPGSVLEYQQAYGQTDTRLAPSGDWHNTIRMGHGNPYNYYSNTIAMQMTGSGSGRIRTQLIHNNSPQGWRTVWDSANDGSGSGLDADLLDGQHGSYYAPASHVHSYLPINNPTATGTLVSPIIRARKSQTQGNYTTAALWTESYSSTNTGIAFHINGNVGKMLDMRTDGHLYWENGRVWSATSDGSGSGLDADLLDGQHGSYYYSSANPPPTYSKYLRSDADDSFTGNNLLFPTLSLNISNSNVSGSGNTYFRGSNTHFVLGLTSGNTLYMNYGNAAGSFNLSGNVTHNGSNPGTVLWGNSNDGSGSGLDADLLDGLQGSRYVANQDGLRYTTDFNTILTSGFYNAQVTPANAPGHYGQLIVAKGVDTGMQIYGGYNNDNLWFRGWASSGATLYPWRKVWHDANDGSGSGLDADLLDGQQPSALSVNYANTAGSANSAGHLPTLYAGGQQTNPQVYFNSATGLKVAMTGYPNVWSDTLWINGYSGGDVVNMCALHLIRNGQPRMWISSQSNRGTSYGTAYEFWSSYNDGSGSGLDADLLDGYQGTTYIGKFGNSYYQASTWIELTGGHGVYAPSINNAHFHPNDSASYGTWRIIGSRAGYTGIHLATGNVNVGMFDAGGNGGEWSSSATGGWHYYYHRGNRCLGVSGSSTSGSYGLYEQGGGIYSTGNITAYSDRRVKENIRTIDNALETVEKMRGVYYNRIDDEEKKTVIGFIAQEVDEVEGAKPLVTYAEDVDQYGVSYGNTAALLVEAIKDLSQQVKDLQAEIKELKNA